MFLMDSTMGVIIPCEKPAISGSMLWVFVRAPNKQIQVEFFETSEFRVLVDWTDHLTNQLPIIQHPPCQGRSFKGEFTIWIPRIWMILGLWDVSWILMTFSCIFSMCFPIEIYLTIYSVIYVISSVQCGCKLWYLTYDIYSGWWFQIFLIFTPTLGKIPMLITINIFKMGWNRQPVLFHYEINQNTWTPL